MPRRGQDNGGGQPQQNGAVAQQGQQQPPANATDAWNTINNMKPNESGDSNGFTKLNTTFYLKNTESIDTMLLSENPVIIWAHTIKCLTKTNKEYYRTEQCQKSKQQTCVFCDSNNKSVGKAKQTVMFNVLESRGSYNPETKQKDGDPVPAIFITPTYLAQQFGVLKDSAGGSLKGKVITLSKNGQYAANLKLTPPDAQGNVKYATHTFTGDLPNILEVYAPLSDAEAADFINQNAVGGGQPQQQQFQQQPSQQMGQQGNGTLGAQPQQNARRQGSLGD